jgi:hypothetical protein
MATYEHRDVVDTPHERTAAVARTHHFSPGQLLSGAVGVLLVIVGIIAVTRNGIDGSLEAPTTDIFGLAHSSLVGLVEIGAGLLLLVGSASRSARSVAGFVGALLIVAGIVVAAGTSSLQSDLGTETSTGWFLAVMGAIALLGSLLPSIVRSDREVTSDYVERPVA